MNYFEIFEIKEQGAPDRATRALIMSEMLDVLEKSRTKVKPRDANIKQFAHPAFLLTQFHLDARLDDITLLDSDEIRPYPKQNRQVLQVSIKSSKNIHKKSDWHWQVLIGCMNPLLCVFIALAAYVGYFDNANELDKHPGRVVNRVNGEKKKKVHGATLLGGTTKP